MTGMLHNIRQFLAGKITVVIKIKYTLICLGLGFIHIIFTIVFGAGDIKPLFWYNMGVVLLYLYIALVAVQKEHYQFSVVMVYVEVLTCSIISSFMLGWNWGFSMYALAMIPATYYLTYTLARVKKKILLPTLMSAGIGICYILTRAICGRIDPLYDGNIRWGNMQISFYYFNIIIAYFMLLLFSTMFAVENLHMQRKLERENVFLGEAASIDPLTNMLNRRSMNSRLKSAIESADTEGTALGIILIDLDDFKHVNDTYGHDCGDEILISIAQIIARNVGCENAICRWGGEEILIMIQDDLTVTKGIAEQICKDVETSVVVHKGQEIKVTLTAGLAEYKSGQGLRALIEEADHNMYYGKQSGKNRVVTSEDRVVNKMR